MKVASTSNTRDHAVGASSRYLLHTPKSQFRCRLDMLHRDDAVFLAEHTGDDWDAWRLQFAELWSPNAAASPNDFHDHCAALLEGSQSLAAAFTTFVPSSVSEETFWCRYLYARRFIIPHEHALFVLEKETASFTTDPVESDFNHWKDMFVENWEQHDAGIVSDCTVALENSQLLSSQYRSLVPSAVCARDFWCRYLFRRALLVRSVTVVEPEHVTVAEPSHVTVIEPPQSSICSASPAPDVAANPTSECDSHISASQAFGAEDDDHRSSLSQATATISGEASTPASLAGDATSLTQPHASADSQSPNSGSLSSSTPEVVASKGHHIPGSSPTALPGPPASSEVAAWDEWE